MTDGSQQHILVIEDHAPNATLVVDLLSFHGFRVTWASDGEQGLEMLKNDRPDLILMDIQMPKMDGYTLTRQLKADESTKTIPIVALTACAMVGDAERALEAGCDGYLTKPVNTRELPKTVKRFLQAEAVPAAPPANAPKQEAQSTAVPAAAMDGAKPATTATPKTDVVIKAASQVEPGGSRSARKNGTKPAGTPPSE